MGCVPARSMKATDRICLGLVHREESLTSAEAAARHHFLELEHIPRMAKAKARLILAKWTAR